MSDHPVVLDQYWEMWNERDVEKVRAIIDEIVSEEFLFVDPMHSHVGRDALESNVRGFRSRYPEARFELVSDIDGHHDRYRYHWNLVDRGRVRLLGFDVTTINGDGLIERIDGFFGVLERHAD